MTKYKKTESGDVFGRWTVIKLIGSNKQGNKRYLCECICGTRKNVLDGSLKLGLSRSCGCLQKEETRDRTKTHGACLNGKTERLYRIYKAMHTRCNNTNFPSYKYYGGIGIKICSEWSGYVSFREWALNNGYSNNLTIDRIDPYGIYEPANCRWADSVTQCRNTRKIKDKGFCAAELSKKLGGSNTLIISRLKLGWSIERAINIPARVIKKRTLSSPLTSLT